MLNDVAETVTYRQAPLSTDRDSNRPEFYRGVARLAILAAEALDYAHERGVVHRDVKPGNLLLDEAGKVYITDFGLARMETAGELTATGDLIGTLRYMSPEQATAARGMVDQRSDVYSLGATFYEILTLRPVFSAADRAVLLRQIAEDDPVALRKIDRSIPAELETIVLKCLEKEADDRYPTAAALADDLARYLSHQPLKAKRAPWTERLRKWSRRHQVAVVAAAATISLSSVALLASGLWVAHEHEQTLIEQTTSRQHKELAQQHEQIAGARQSMLRQFAYVSRINQAHIARQRGDPREVQRLLAECLPETGEEDLRGFEWFWLSRSIESVAPVWRRHAGEVYAARFSHDSRRLATCGQDGVRVWSWPAGDQLAHLTAHAYDVNDVGFLPDDALLATASDDGTVKIWDTADWSVQRTLAHQGRVIAAHFSPDGRVLACAERCCGAAAASEQFQIVRMWDVDSWQEQPALVGPLGEPHSLAWSPNGTLLATGGGGDVKVWGFPSASVRFDLKPNSPVNCIAFAHQRAWLAVGTQRRTVFYSLETGHELASLPHGAGSVAFSSDDRSILTAGRDGMARLWEYTGPGEQIAESVTFHDSAPLWCAEFAPDNRTIITTRHDGAVKRWDRQQPDGQVFLPGVTGKTSEAAIEFAHDGKTLLVNNDSLKLVDLETGGILQSLTAPGDVARIMSMSPDGKRMATVDLQWQVSLWDTEHWRKRPILGANGESIHAIAFLPDEEWPLVVARGRMFFAGSAAPVSNLIPSEDLDNVGCVALRPDGRMAATLGSRLARLQVWDLRKAEPCLTTPQKYICAAFSNDGRLLAAGEFGGVTRLWQTDTWGEPLLLVGHSDYVRAIAISPDSRTVATCANDATIRLWHAATGRELLTFDTRVREPQCLRFSADGKMLAVSGAEDNEGARFQVVLWRGEQQK